MPKGAYTTTRTFNSGSHIFLWDFHLNRVTQSLLLLAEAHPELFPNLPPSLLTDLLSTIYEAQGEEVRHEEGQENETQMRDTRRARNMVAGLQKEIRDSVLVAVRAMVECDWWRREAEGEQKEEQQQQQQQVEVCLMILLCGQGAAGGAVSGEPAASGAVTCEPAASAGTAGTAIATPLLQGVEVYVHASTVRTTPLASLALPPPICAAVMGPGRHTPLAKFSSWPLVRRALETAKPAEARDVILSTDGNALLEGITTNLFIVARTEPASDTSHGPPWRGYELQTASLESGILPGSIRQAIIDACGERGIPIRIQAPQWSERATWVEAFVTNALSIVQPVSSMLMPATWPSDIGYDSWQSVDKWLTWQAPTLEENYGSRSTFLLEHVIGHMTFRSAELQDLLTTDD
ncbi:hypothetical protein CLOM_g22310 [Closterium sp. NIES-68]|nr:hypothetical protein CLOM_g22310 [Closterium sp. NIES-68]GJP64412.1 hypothetical protein CLOP_g21409 [Closterium sp. NIES-67]